jgi:hypothetical protein
MDELKTYQEWELIISQETGIQVVDPDGYRMVLSEGKQNELMTKQQATKYFAHNTIMLKIT